MSSRTLVRAGTDLAHRLRRRSRWPATSSLGHPSALGCLMLVGPRRYRQRTSTVGGCPAGNPGQVRGIRDETADDLIDGQVCEVFRERRRRRLSNGRALGSCPRPFGGNDFVLNLCLGKPEALPPVTGPAYQLVAGDTADAAQLRDALRWDADRARPR